MCTSWGPVRHIPSRHTHIDTTDLVGDLYFMRFMTDCLMRQPVFITVLESVASFDITRTQQYIFYTSNTWNILKRNGDYM